MYKRQILLTSGVRVSFAAPLDGKLFEGGDYWTLPVRVATGLEWPKGAYIPPAGVYHHYAPLAVVNVAVAGDPQSRKDLRSYVASVAEQVT